METFDGSPEKVPKIESVVGKIYTAPEEEVSISLQISDLSELPSNNKNQYDPRLLKEIFPPDKAEGAYMLGIIAIHGNEPQIMTAAVAAEINQILAEYNLPGASIVLPSIYGDRTRTILQEDFPALSKNIFLSDRLGEILKKTEFSRAGYQAHLREVEQHQPEVHEELLEFLSRPFEATSLDGEVKEFKPEGKRLEINAGANVTASTPGEKKLTLFFLFYFLKCLKELLLTPQLVLILITKI